MQNSKDQTKRNIVFIVMGNFSFGWGPPSPFLLALLPGLDTGGDLETGQGQLALGIKEDW